MLDCETEVGKVFIKSEDETADFLDKYLLGDKYSLVKFDRKTSSADRIAVLNDKKNGFIRKKSALLEIKSRQQKRITFERSFNNSYLISEHKILSNIDYAKSWKIPFFVFVNLMNDDYILRIKVSDNDGNIVAPHTIEKRQTQNTCNGGLKTDTVYLFDIVTPHAYFISKSNTISNFKINTL